MIVTDIKWKDKSGNERVGFYMHGYLASNLIGIPKYLNQGWDAVGIISGNGKVRIGKSTLAMQVGSLITWLLAGGKMEIKPIEENGKEILRGKVIKSPKKEIKFSLEENVVFSARDLKKRASELYNKYGKQQLIIYDEGRQGLASSRAMESLNKEMEDFFQECGFMEMVILLVLPNFFKLHEDYAVSRSLFLIDCFKNSQNRRGYFNFYNEHQKEWLFFLGKKRIGISFKYKAASETFWGRFTKWFPFNEAEYERLKREGLRKKTKTKKEKRYFNQRNAAFWILNKDFKVSAVKLALKINRMCEDKIHESNVKVAMGEAEKVIEKVEELMEDGTEQS